MQEANAMHGCESLGETAFFLDRLYLNINPLNRDFSKRPDKRSPNRFKEIARFLLEIYSQLPTAQGCRLVSDT
jgi:hypothetical protein